MLIWAPEVVSRAFPTFAHKPKVFFLVFNFFGHLLDNFSARLSFESEIPFTIALGELGKIVEFSRKWEC